MAGLRCEGVERLEMGREVGECKKSARADDGVCHRARSFSRAPLLRRRA